MATERLKQANEAAASLATVEKDMAGALMSVAEETAKEWGVHPGDKVEEGDSSVMNKQTHIVM